MQSPCHAPLQSYVEELPDSDDGQLSTSSDDNSSQQSSESSPVLTEQIQLDYPQYHKGEGYCDMDDARLKDATITTDIDTRNTVPTLDSDNVPLQLDDLIPDQHLSHMHSKYVQYGDSDDDTGSGYVVKYQTEHDTRDLHSKLDLTGDSLDYRSEGGSVTSDDKLTDMDHHTNSSDAESDNDCPVVFDFGVSTVNSDVLLDDTKASADRTAQGDSATSNTAVTFDFRTLPVQTVVQPDTKGATLTLLEEAAAEVEEISSDYIQASEDGGFSHHVPILLDKNHDTISETGYIDSKMAASFKGNTEKLETDLTDTTWRLSDSDLILPATNASTSSGYISKCTDSGSSADYLHWL